VTSWRPRGSGKINSESLFLTLPTLLSTFQIFSELHR
jgi:hypothetical protein